MSTSRWGALRETASTVLFNIALLALVAGSLVTMVIVWLTSNSWRSAMFCSGWVAATAEIVMLAILFGDIFSRRPSSEPTDWFIVFLVLVALLSFASFVIVVAYHGLLLGLLAICTIATSGLLIAWFGRWRIKRTFNRINQRSAFSVLHH
jgi:hypothetical protein